MVVIDTTPLVPVSDARIIARFGKATLIVASAGTTTRRQISRAIERLDADLGAADGAVLNNYRAAAARRYYGPAESTKGSRQTGKQRRRSRARGPSDGVAQPAERGGAKRLSDRPVLAHAAVAALRGPARSLSILVRPQRPGRGRCVGLVALALVVGFCLVRDRAGDSLSASPPAPLEGAFLSRTRSSRSRRSPARSASRASPATRCRRTAGSCFDRTTPSCSGSCSSRSRRRVQADDRRSRWRRRPLRELRRAVRGLSASSSARTGCSGGSPGCSRRVRRGRRPRDRNLLLRRDGGRDVPYTNQNDFGLHPRDHAAAHVLAAA